MVGPTFMPIGFLMPRMNSTCAPSSWRVRSPIHSKWAEVSYQSPEVESTRVIASSKGSSRALVAGEELGLAHLRQVSGDAAGLP